MIAERSKRLGHIADRQSKYLPRRNVGVRPLRARVRLFGKAYGGPSKWPLRVDGWSMDGLQKSTVSIVSSLFYPLPPTSSYLSSILLSSDTIYRPSCPIRCVKRYRIIIAVYVGRCSYDTLSDHRTGIICSQKQNYTDQGKVTCFYLKINFVQIFLRMISTFINSNNMKHIKWQKFLQVSCVSDIFVCFADRVKIRLSKLIGK